MSVVVHEFAHGLVAYLGGDYTIRERGGLTLNPLQYVDPVMSIVLPVVVLLAPLVSVPTTAAVVVVPDGADADEPGVDAGVIACCSCAPSSASF